MTVADVASARSQSFWLSSKLAVSSPFMSLANLTLALFDVAVSQEIVITIIEARVAGGAFSLTGR